ncbi:MAG: hypothetical protein ABJA82_16980 [Myxococcales bacterium]
MQFQAYGGGCPAMFSSGTKQKEHLNVIISQRVCAEKLPQLSTRSVFAISSG